MLNRFNSGITDAFLVAVTIPNLLRELLAEGALVNSFIPVYKSLNTVERRKFAQAFSGIMIAVNLILMAVGIFAAPLIVAKLLGENSNVDRATALYMTQLVVPFLMLISLSSIAMGLLNADEHFKESSFAPIAFNIASIIALLFFPSTATWLAIGWLIGGVAQLVVQLPALNRFGLLPSPSLSKHPALARVFKQMVPFTFTAGARQFLNIYVVILLTSGQFSGGTRTGYGNAESLFTMVTGLFIISPVMAFFPRFAQNAADKNWPTFKNLTLQAIRNTTFFTAIMSALLVALAPFAVSLFNTSRHFEVPKFEAGAAILTGWGLALVPWAIVTVLLRTFYARQRTREAVTISAIGFVAEVGLYSFLVPKLGLLGFGISTTLSGILIAGALAFMYRRTLGFPAREVISHLAKVVPLAVLSGLVAWEVSKFMPQPGFILNGLIGLAIAGGIGMSIYIIGAILLKMPEVSVITRRLKRG